LNPQVWRYALLDAGPGAMLWRDEAGHVVAFNIAHARAPRVDGTLAVRPDRQGAGVGKTIVRTALDWLLEQNVATLGLETMPRTVENIGFYARLGFFPGHLTVTLTNDIVTRGHRAPVLLSQRKDAAATRRSRRPPPRRRARSRLRLHSRDPAHAELGLGDTSLIDGDDGLDALVLWHSAPLAEGRPKDEVRVLKLAARDPTASRPRSRPPKPPRPAPGSGASPCDARPLRDAFRRLVARGYRVRWTDLRMTYEGYPEAHPGCGVLFSNWEI